MKALLLSVSHLSCCSRRPPSLIRTWCVRSRRIKRSWRNRRPMATLVFAEAVTLTAVKIESTGGIKITPKPLPAGPAAELSVALPD